MYEGAGYTSAVHANTCVHVHVYVQKHDKKAIGFVISAGHNTCTYMYIQCTQVKIKSCVYIHMYMCNDVLLIWRWNISDVCVGHLCTCVCGCVHVCGVSVCVFHVLSGAMNHGIIMSTNEGLHGVCVHMQNTIHMIQNVHKCMVAVQRGNSASILGSSSVGFDPLLFS